jgi:hypothetical protein
MKRLLLVVGIALLSGCAVHPVFQVEHLSHPFQHIRRDKENLGGNIASVGLRGRPIKGVTVDVMWGYTVGKAYINGENDIFQARMTWEAFAP